MLRTALRPRWLALLVVVLLAATGMSLLGRWQLHRAYDRGRPAVGTAAPVPLGGVLPPRQIFPASAVGKRVVAEGQWDAARRLIVTDRQLAGRSGGWLLVPLRLADGSAVPVVLGWVSGSADPAVSAFVTAPTTAKVQVTGRLEPDEVPVQRPIGASDPAPGDPLQSIAATDLIARWPYPLTTGYLVLESAAPALAGPAPVLVPPEKPSGSPSLQNLSYALQWWIFAGFGLFLWYRLVRDDHLGRLPGPARKQAPVRQGTA